jgi:hypothetical protein
MVFSARLKNPNANGTLWGGERGKIEKKKHRCMAHFTFKDVSSIASRFRFKKPLIIAMKIIYYFVKAQSVYEHQFIGFIDYTE